MTGSGNDFILVDNMNRNYNVGEIIPYIAKICTHRLSVGADGFIMIEPDEKADFMWHFYNSDGSPAEMCGNGARCAARFAYLNGYTERNMSFLTTAGLIHAEIKEGVNVKVQLTQPSGMIINKEAPLYGIYTAYSYIVAGNPHVVIFDDNIENADVKTAGSQIRNHREFAPNGANVNFVHVTGKDTLRVRTYERGVEDETLACGTGSAASALIAIETGLVSSPVTIKTSGNIDMKVYKEDELVYLEGEARVVATGTIAREAMEY